MFEQGILDNGHDSMARIQEHPHSWKHGLDLTVRWAEEPR